MKHAILLTLLLAAPANAWPNSGKTFTLTVPPGKHLADMSPDPLMHPLWALYGGPAQARALLAADNARLTAEVEALTGALQDVLAWDKARGFIVPYRVRDPLFAALEAAEIASWPPEMQAEYRATMASRGVAKRIAEDQIAARDAGEGRG